MDISNLKEKAPEIKQGLELENMYEIGYRQLDCYKPLERLPEYPMDINSTKNQSLMKTLISQVVEELMEGYESTSNINDILENKGWNTNLYTDVEEIQQEEFYTESQMWGSRGGNGFGSSGSK